MNTKNTLLPEIGFIRLPTVTTVTGAATSTIWAWVKQGLFPKPYKTGPNSTAWRAEEVRQWMTEKTQQDSGGRHG